MDAEAILAAAPGRRFLVAGDVMLDHYVWGDAERLSPEAPVPVVGIERDTYVAGGAANVALNLAALGARVEVAGATGRDEAGRRLRGLLRAAGVGFETARHERPGRATIVKTRVLVRHQQLCRLDREQAPAAYAPGEAETAALAARAGEFDAVILSDYAKGFLTDALAAALRDAAHAAGRLVAWDPKPKHGLRCPGVDLMTPNRREAQELAGMAHEPWDAAAVCRRLHRLHRPRHLVVTLGEHGMLLASRGRVGAAIPTAAREVFDVSGAGDTAIAAITLALAAGAGLEEAAHFGNAAAGVVVGKLGTATVTPAELRAHLAAVGTGGA